MLFRHLSVALLALLVVASVFASAEVYFKETFDKDWSSRWVTSSWKKSSGEAGEWKRSAGDFYADAEKDAGIQTSQDARFYAISSKFPAFSNEGKDLVLQYQVRFPQSIDCGGGYIKLMPSNTDQSSFSGDSKYYIMFGPDVCGATRRTHVIFNYKDTNHLVKKTISCESDQLSHVYTLIVRPNNTYEVRVDGSKRESGSLYDDWDFLPPRTIKDPSQSKPSDWVDDPQMDDPTDVKPADWADQPRQVPDPAAQKPDDWDDEADGEWEAPLIDNPDFKGEWKPKRIPNPDYKGPWEHPEIPNPDFVDDASLYRFNDIGTVGFELWQVKSGTIIDNILVTDDIATAESFLEETYTSAKGAERQSFDDFNKAKNQAADAERAQAAEAAKAAAEEAGSDEEESQGHDEL